MITYIFIFILGSIVGSFLNVCIHRMPQQGYSLVRPPSYCPKCRKPIPWYDNIPLLSYILLRGRCRFCSEKISFRYFIVEFITAGLFLLLYLRFGLNFNFLVYSILVCGLIVATFIDIGQRIIPDEISLGGIGLGVIFALIRSVHLSPFAFLPAPLRDSFMGIIIGGGSLYITGRAFDFIYFGLLKKPPIQGEKESMGGGDIKLLAMIGAFLGWQKALLVFFIAPFMGSVAGVVNLMVKKNHTIPYGPFLTLGAVISLLWGENILRFLFF
jgi:leader peptidase (prepilin peptidase)/N-methyltransferase